MSYHDNECSCGQQLSQLVSAYQQHKTESVVYQTSLMSSLLSGVYEGSTTIAELLKQGDFGLGTFNQLDGELIAFDSEVHQLCADGSARAAKPEQQTPFAVMTFFRPQWQMKFDKPIDQHAIHQLINQQVASDNLFCALRLNGYFTKIATRTVPKQTRPYQPMQQVTAQQPIFNFHQQVGVMIGFRTPQYMQGINVAGYHEHFITEDRQGGGHVLEYQLMEGVLEFGSIYKLVVDLPTDPEFLVTDLNPKDLDTAIRSVESSKE